jgi:hypothetical protein
VRSRAYEPTGHNPRYPPGGGGAAVHVSVNPLRPLTGRVQTGTSH